MSQIPSLTDPSSFLTEIDSAHGSMELRERFAELARTVSTSHLRESGPIHFTASGIVLDRSGRHIALHFHRKVGAWLQFGGHIEPGETSFLQAALREVQEESGLTNLTVVGDAPLRLHAHELNSNFAVCSEHWDVQYLLRTSFDAQHPTDGLSASTESSDLAWFELGALPNDLVSDLHEVISGPVERAARAF